MVKHLLYFICPIAKNGIWQWNVEQLLQRISLFNGKRIIAIATGNRHIPMIRSQPLDPPDAIRQAFAGHDVEFIEVPNERAKGEMAAWRQLWGRVVNEPGVTFYSHAKGVSKPNHPTVQWWTRLMYETCLDYWPLVEQLLRDYPVAGSFKKIGQCFLNPFCQGAWTGQSSHHFSGTMYWVRNDDWRMRAWDSLELKVGASEAAPGHWFYPDQTGTLFMEGPPNRLNMYDVPTCGYIEREYAIWQEQYAWAKSSTSATMPAAAKPS